MAVSELLVVEESGGSRYPYVGPLHVDPKPYVDTEDYERLYWGRKDDEGAPEPCFMRNTPYWGQNTRTAAFAGELDYGEITYFNCGELQHRTFTRGVSAIEGSPFDANYPGDISAFATPEGYFWLVGVDSRNSLINMIRIKPDGTHLIASFDARDNLPATYVDGSTVPPKEDLETNYGQFILQQSGILGTVGFRETGTFNQFVFLIKIDSNGDHVSTNWVNRDPPGSSPWNDGGPFVRTFMPMPMPDGYADAINNRGARVASSGAVTYGSVNSTLVRPFDIQFTGFFIDSGELWFANQATVGTIRTYNPNTFTVGSPPGSLASVRGSSGEFIPSATGDRVLVFRDNRYKVFDGEGNLLIEKSTNHTLYSNIGSVEGWRLQFSFGNINFGEGIEPNARLRYGVQRTDDNEFMYPPQRNIDNQVVNTIRKFSADSIISTKDLGGDPSKDGNGPLGYHPRGQWPHFDYSNWI